MFWFLALSSRKALLTKSVCAERENEFVSCLFNPFCKRKNIKQQNGVQKSNFNQNISFRKGNKDFPLTDGQNPFIYVRCFLSRFWFEIQRGTLIMWWNIWLLDSSLIIKVLWLGCRIRFIRGTSIVFCFTLKNSTAHPKNQVISLDFWDAQLSFWVCICQGRRQMLACLWPEILCT